MGFDLDALRQAANKYGPIARVVVADVAGSTPRDIGASMLVWKTGQSGTIGGGALEYQAAHTAREAIEQRKTRALFSRHPLGPDLGQCCGGSVALVTEFFSTKSMPQADGNLLIRRITGASTLPFAAKRVLADHRGQGVLEKPGLYDGWMIEPVFAPSAQLWIWGAGHVGRALVHMFAPLPDLEITWVDTDLSRFPDRAPERVILLPAKTPTALIKHAPQTAQHLILTFSHSLDLELCNGLLRHGFDWTGLIGSATKWARFKKRLQALGHNSASINRITCPIGSRDFGKHPAEIAIGVSAAFLARRVEKRALTRKKA